MDWRERDYQEQYNALPCLAIVVPSCVVFWAVVYWLVRMVTG